MQTYVDTFWEKTYYIRSMENLNSQFNNELQQQIEGTLPKEHIYNLGYPGEILLSAGIENLPIELSAARLALKASKEYESGHPFDLSDIKNLPDAINNPIAVFNSTKKDNAKIILTELKDKNGHSFIVIIKIRKGAKNRKVGLDRNSIVSIFPKDQVADLINWLKSGNKLTAWLDREKALCFVSSQSSDVIAGGHKEGSIINIVNNFENVK